MSVAQIRPLYPHHSHEKINTLKEINSMANTAKRTLAVNTFRLREGKSPEDFVKFSAEVDQPTLGDQEEVLRFRAFRVLGEAEGGGVGFEFIELLEIGDWDEWIAVRDNSPALSEVRSGFDELVEPGSVRCSFAEPIGRSSED
ncbi:hypothetical protein E4P29_25640 [Rhodococcus sp. 1R11]|uniref:hypothetical protein n=1 Tax=Rhodococcus sp. 1R11 TaxID=2559614 RepID=UPI0010722E3C|nr:hypothetical protein [Rhodococcus sp. 1R11]TFI40201.1 hypothetical protein E4P29_25640 [Rhodococcus sp. 1R11]